MRSLLIFHLFCFPISPESDFTLLIGNRCKDTNKGCHKLLLLRPTNMLCNSIYSKDELDQYAQQIYNILRPYAGKRGYEVNRTCGSSGRVNQNSDKNLLCFLSDHEASLPRYAHGCMIIRGIDRYYIAYAKTNPTIASTHTLWHYTPPQDGGQFNMPDECISRFPPIAEMIYLKALTICTLVEINEFFVGNGRSPVATGPLKYEYKSILKARQKISHSNQQNSMFHFLSTFNAFNHFSMVAYPVGMHLDYFKNKEESLENKLLLCTGKRNNTVGRGGCITGTNYVFALLDW